MLSFVLNFHGCEDKYRKKCERLLARVIIFKSFRNTTVGYFHGEKRIDSVQIVLGGIKGRELGNVKVSLAFLFYFLLFIIIIFYLFIYFFGLGHSVVADNVFREGRTCSFHVKFHAEDSVCPYTVDRLPVLKKLIFQNEEQTIKQLP